MRSARVCLAVLAMVVSATGRGAPMPDPGFAVLARGETTTFDTMVERLARADVVFVGENHDHTQGHALELSLLQALAGRTQRQALSLEMFERDTQLVLDEYTRGLISEQHFLASSRPWPNYRADYAPLVELARQKGVPVIAANAPRRYVNIVSRKGRAALNDLPRESRSYLPPLPYSMEMPPAYDQELSTIFEEQHAQAGGMPGMPSVERMKEAQALWDVSMADSIWRFLRTHRGWHVMQVNGAQHSDHGYGIVDRLRRLDHKLDLVVVSIKPDAAYPNLPAERYRDLADYVIVTPSPAPVPARGAGAP